MKQKSKETALTTPKNSIGRTEYDIAQILIENQSLILHEINKTINDEAPTEQKEKK